MGTFETPNGRFLGERMNNKGITNYKLDETACRLIKYCLDNAKSTRHIIKSNMLEQAVNKIVSSKSINDRDELDIIIRLLGSYPMQQNEDEEIEEEISGTMEKNNNEEYADHNRRILLLLEELRLFRRKMDLDRDKNKGISRIRQ